MQRSRVHIIVALVFASLALTIFAQPQNPRQLFERARMLDESNQNLPEAIKLYSQVVKQSQEQRALAARAQLRVGLLYERLGRKAEAQRAFQVVVNQYADQAEVARQAQAKLPASLQAKSNRSATGKVTGLTVRQVWTGSRVDPLGKPLPDGKSFVFTDWERGDIALRELASEKTRYLTNKGSWFQSSEFGVAPIPSPDGKQVAYYWSDKNQKGELRLVGIDGSQARVLYRNDDVVSPIPVQWSPDARQVLTILRGKDKTHQLAFISVADGSARVLRSLGPYYPLVVSLSPDGRYIAYDLLPEEEATATDIYLWSVTEGRETLLVKHAANDIPLGWTPDGNRLFFASDRTESIGAWMIAVLNGKAQGTPVLIKPEMGRFFPMAFINNGTYFFGQRAGMQDVYSVTMDWATDKPTATPLPVSQRSIGANASADWSPDGKLLAWVTLRSLMTGEMGWQTLSIHSFETDKTRELKLKLNSFDRPRWSPDGRFVLLYATDRKGGKGIHRVDVNTGESLAITLSDANTNPHQATWAKGGKAILFQRTDYATRNTSLVAREIETGQEREFYRVNKVWGSSHLAPSPDGQQIAFIVYDQAAKNSTIKLVPFSGGEARDLLVQPHELNDPFFFTGLTWMPGGQELLLIKGSSKNEEPNTEIWRLSAAGGTPQKFSLSLDHVRDLRIHPDGKRLAFTAGSQKIEVWAMENVLLAARPAKTVTSRR